MSEEGASPRGTIKWRLHAAKKSLAKLLRPQFRAKSTEALPEEFAPIAVSSDAAKGGNDRG